MKCIKKHRLFKLLNFWPPFWAAGICVKKVSEDLRSVDVEMKLHFWNKNYVGTHFGGSLYSMADPFYMLMLMDNLGPQYIVWDKAAAIKFKKPGRSAVQAKFRLSQADIDDIKSKLETLPKYEPEFTVHVQDKEGNLICEVVKTLYIKKK